MYKHLVFVKPNEIEKSIINTFDVSSILKNNRTNILENNKMRMSIDKKVVRVMLFDENNIELLETIKNFFYGDNYDKWRIAVENRIYFYRIEH